MTKIVGLTGGIGSGKTTVAKMFQDLGIHVYIADLEAKMITNLPSTLSVIKQKFGDSVINNEQLNRKVMAQMVFNNPEKLIELNAIIHPLVAQHFKIWLIDHKDETFIIKETAILFETKSNLACDFVINVTAPISIRIDRVMKRDKTSIKEIKSRIDNQWSDEQRNELSDFTIENVNLEETRKQVSQIFKIISKSSEN